MTEFVSITSTTSETGTETELSPKPRLMLQEDYIQAVEKCAADALLHASLLIADNNPHLALSVLRSICAETEDALCG